MDYMDYYRKKMEEEAGQEELDQPEELSREEKLLNSLKDLRTQKSEEVKAAQEEENKKAFFSTLAKSLGDLGAASIQRSAKVDIGLKPSSPVMPKDVKSGIMKDRDSMMKQLMEEYRILQGKDRYEDKQRSEKDRFDWQKSRAEMQDELSARKYEDSTAKQELSNKLLQKQLEQYGQITPYQQKMIEQQEEQRKLQRELADNKQGKNIYKVGDELVKINEEGKAEKLYGDAKSSKEPSFQEKESIKEQANIRKENLKTRKQAETSMNDLDEQLAKIQRAKKLLSDMKKGSVVDTGPVDQYVSGFTDKGQKLRQAFNDLSLTKMAKLFKGMSKAVDSDAERKMFEQSQASLGNYPEVNMEILDEMEKGILSLKNKNKSLYDRYDKKGNEIDLEAPMESQEKEVPRIKVEINGQVGTVPQDQIDGLLKKYPNAKILN